ncbi:MAG: matrixin family metalloprotease [Cyanobacteria bacterium]|nr:matrixin family metalloprotease [Cyanobacteriota bacterium]
METYTDVFGDGIYNWPKEMLPVKVYIQPGDSVPGYRSNYPTILRQCFDEWIAASNGRLAWVEVNNAAQANIVCRFRAEAPERAGGEEAGLTRTHARFNTETNEGTIYKATMGLSTRLPEREFSEDEIRKVCLHEVGHAFGLAGHSRLRNDIMFASVNRNQVPTLSGRDRSAIVRLYQRYPQTNGAALLRTKSNGRQQS